MIFKTKAPTSDSLTFCRGVVAATKKKSAKLALCDSSLVSKWDSFQSVPKGKRSHCIRVFCLLWALLHTVGLWENRLVPENGVNKMHDTWTLGEYVFV